MIGIRARGAIGDAALLLSAGCGQAAPATSASATTARPPGSAPSQRPTPGSLASPSTSSSAGLEVERLPTDGAPAALTTDGTRIVWSLADASGANPGIYRWQPGGSVELVYRSPNPRANMQSLAASGDHITFCEASTEEVGWISWTFWYLARPGAQPVKLATDRRPVDQPGLVPQPALNRDRLVYAIQRFDKGVLMSELVLIDLGTMKRRVLASTPFDTTEYWYPSLDGSRLVYGTVEYSKDGRTDDRHVYLRDLDRPTDRPRRLDSDGTAADPVIRGGTVVWKDAPRAFNMNNWGELEAYSLADGSIRKLDFASASEGQSHNFPSLGNRFVAADLWDATSLTIYDLATRTEVAVERYEPTSGHALMRPVIAGDLLVWVSAPDFTGAGGEIHYAQLPPAIASP